MELIRNIELLQIIELFQIIELTRIIELIRVERRGHPFRKLYYSCHKNLIATENITLVCK